MQTSNKEEKKPWVTDMWTCNRWNFEENVLAQMRLPGKVDIYDVTLRDGEQQPGVVLRKDDKIKIAKALGNLGIPCIEAGMPAISDEDFRAVKEIANLGLFTKVKAFCMARRDNVDLALKCDVDGVVIELPSSDILIEGGLRKTREWIINTAVDVTNYAKEHGLQVTFFPYDTTRAEPEFLEKLVTTVISQAHIDSVTVVDTFGVSSPQGFQALTKWMKAKIKIPVEVHCHNHLGLATANSLAGVTGGAEVVHTTVNGMGEGTGNASTEEVLVGLRILYGIDTGVKYERLYELSKLVKETSGATVMQSKPIVGETAFAFEAGVPAMYLQRFKAKNFIQGVYPFVPSFVGNSYKLIYGKKSGHHSIEMYLEQKGLKANEEEINEILTRVKDMGIIRRRALIESEMEGIVNEVLK